METKDPKVKTISYDSRTFWMALTIILMTASTLFFGGYLLGTYAIVDKTYFVDNTKNDAFFSGINYDFVCKGCYMKFLDQPKSIGQNYTVSITNVTVGQTYFYVSNSNFYLLQPQTQGKTYLFFDQALVPKLNYYLFQYIGNESTSQMIDFTSVYNLQSVILLEYYTFVIR